MKNVGGWMDAAMGKYETYLRTCFQTALGCEGPGGPTHMSAGAGVRPEIPQ